MQPIRIAGLDPSLRNWGISNALWYPQTGELYIEQISVISTMFATRLNLPKNLKDCAASQTLYKENNRLIGNSDIIVAEIPIGSKSASAMVSYGICVGVLGAVSTDIPLMRVTPMDVKKVVGNGDITKQDVMEWVIDKHPELNPPTRFVRNNEVLLTGKFEHMADSIVAIHAALAKNEFYTLLKSKGYTL